MFYPCVQNITNHNHIAFCFSCKCMYNDSRNLEADPRVGNSTDPYLRRNAFDSRSNYSECSSVGRTSPQNKDTSTMFDASFYFVVGTRPAFLDRIKAPDPTKRQETNHSAFRFRFVSVIVYANGLNVQCSSTTLHRMRLLILLRNTGVV